MARFLIQLCGGICAGVCACARARARVCLCWWCVCVCACVCVLVLLVIVYACACAWWWRPLRGGGGHCTRFCLYAYMRALMHSQHKKTLTSTAIIYTPAACTHQQRNKIPAPQSHTRKKKDKCALQQQYARTWCVRACMSAAQLVTLTPAPVSGSVCGGGGVCLWLAFLFRFVGALCMMCGVCVCECEWEFIYWVRASR